MDVVFDLGKVLVDWDPRHLFVGHHGMQAEDAERLLSDVCTADWHIEFDRGRPFDEGVELLARAHPQQREWIASYARDWQKMFAGPIASTVEQLNELHRRGTRLHALSNYPPQQIRFLYERFDFMRLFETVVISGLHRLIKPQAEIFERLLTSIGADTCIFVDDNAENIAAARAAGLTAIHFTRDEGPQRLADFVASAP